MGEQTAGGMTGQRIRVHDAALTDVQMAHGSVRSPCPHMSCTSSEPLVYKVRRFPGEICASTGSNAGDNRTLMEALVVALQAQALATHSQSNSFNTQAHAKLWTTTVLAAERIMRHRAELCLVRFGVKGKSVCHASVGRHRRGRIIFPRVLGSRSVAGSGFVEDLVVDGGGPIVVRPFSDAEHQADRRREGRPSRVDRKLEGVTQVPTKKKIEAGPCSPYKNRQRRVHWRRTVRDRA